MLEAAIISVIWRLKIVEIELLSKQWLLDIYAQNILEQGKSKNVKKL